MRRLRTEGGWLFIIALAALFGAVGLYMGWTAFAAGTETLVPAVMLVGMACIVLVLGREEIFAALDLRRERTTVPACVDAIILSRTMNVSHTRHRWRIKAMGRLPDGRTAEFLSPYVIAASQPNVLIGSTVAVDVSPRTGRYRMDLGSLVFAGGAGSDPATGAGGARRRSPGWGAAVRARLALVIALVVLVGWIGLISLDRGFLRYGWIVVPVVVCLMLADYLPVFLLTLRRARAVVRAFETPVPLPTGKTPGEPRPPGGGIAGAAEDADEKPTPHRGR